MAMSNAERQQRYRDKRTRERNDAVTRALVTVLPRNVTAVTPNADAIAQDEQVSSSAVAPIGRVDLEALRRDIREWTTLQSTLNRAKGRAKRIEIKDRITNMILLAIAVSFYGLIAYSAIMQGR